MTKTLESSESKRKAVGKEIIYTRYENMKWSISTSNIQSFYLYLICEQIPGNNQPTQGEVLKFKNWWS